MTASDARTARQTVAGRRKRAHRHARPTRHHTVPLPRRKRSLASAMRRRRRCCSRRGAAVKSGRLSAARAAASRTKAASRVLAAMPARRRMQVSTERTSPVSQIATSEALGGVGSPHVAAVVSEYRVFANAGKAAPAGAGPVRRPANSRCRSRPAARRRPELRGKEGRHRPRNATSRAWQCLRSHGFSDRERDENCALAIAWKHAHNPTRRQRDRRHGRTIPRARALRRKAGVRISAAPSSSSLMLAPKRSRLSRRCQTSRSPLSRSPEPRP